MLMRSLSVLLALALVAPASFAQGGKTVSGPLRFKMKSIDGKELDLASFKGKVVLFVNVASECGYTSQYAGLQKLYEELGKDGLVIVGVPSNEFGGQEPGTEEQIKKFCDTRYKVTFPMTAKVEVNGAGQTPLYKFLTSKETNPKHAGEIRWNFEKFLLGRDGQVLARFASDVEPEDLADPIRKALGK
jgi:glutathione peroxidase